MTERSILSIVWRGFWRTIWRTIVVATGLLCGAITAVVMLVFLGGKELSRTYTQVDAADPLLAMFDQVIGTIMFATALGPALTLVPALAAVVVGEVARIRSAIYYVLTGGFAVLAIPYLYETGDGISGAVNPQYVVLFLASGFIAGFMYWLVAGRGA